MLRIALCGVLVMLAFAPVAPAQSLQSDWRARAGVDKAKAAGIEVDPAVEEAMARAPVGSCVNDPTQTKCPKAKSVVASPTAEQLDGSVAFAPSAPPEATARAAQWPWQCQLRLSDASPYKAAGYAQMNASATCSVAVTAVELYGTLWKLYNGAWHRMATRGERRPGGTTARVHTTYACTATPRRTWHAHAEGWALLNGGWYHAERRRNNDLYCG